MVVSRVEESPNNRAGCQNAECKKAAIKITKGELRYAIQVTINEHQSWQYRHWGCVTPKQISNLIETTEGDTELVDGFDELSDENQEKIKFALENGHIPDEDWKGDVEKNRPGQTGFRNRATKKKVNDGEDEDDAEKPKKKRARKAKDEAEDEDEAPAPKKKRGKAVKKEASDASEDEAPPPKKARGKKAVKKEESDEEAEPPAPKKAKAKKAAKKEEGEGAEPAPLKKGRGKKAAPKEEPAEDEEADEEEAPKPKRGKKTAATADSSDKAAPKRGRKKKAAASDE